MVSIADLVRSFIQVAINPVLIAGVLTSMALFRELRPRWGSAFRRLMYDIVGLALGTVFFLLLLIRVLSTR